MADNGENEGRDRIKKCPFLKEWCIKEECVLWTELSRKVGGMIQKTGVCAFSALVVILSEVNMKTGGQQEQIRLPRLYKG